MIFSYDSDFVFVGHVQMSLLLLLRDNQALRFISPSDYHDLFFHPDAAHLLRSDFKLARIVNALRGCHTLKSSIS